jgi:hypothetical protein
MMRVANFRTLNFAFLAVTIALFFAFLFKDQLSVPPSIEETKASTGFDAPVATARLARILGDERPHRVDTPANDAVRERLLVEIRSLGLKPEIRDDFACRSTKRWGGASCARVRNVVVRMGPSGGDAIMVAAHYDSVAAGPGAADDGAGVASLLEIGAQLRGRTLTKPVILLFTDGEEAGLLGAASFVRSDPYANDVAFAINLEARGTGGPAIMFQTSTPNKQALAVFGHQPVRPVANSLAADIYRSLPNDTDATEFLSRGYEVLNYAFIEPLARYHSSIDSLKWLDRKSVGHLGSSGLRAVESYLVQPGRPSKPSRNVIYTDVVGRALLVMPTWAGAALIGLGLLASITMFIRAGGGRSIQVLFSPLLATILAGGICYGATALINAFRPEALWWYSEPRAAVAVIAAAGLLGVTVSLLAFARGASMNRLVAGAWIWIFAFAAFGGFFSQGSLILTAPAAGMFVLVWLLTFWKPNFPGIVWLIPAIALLGIILPTLSFAGSALGYAMAWAVAALAGLLFMPALALVYQSKHVDWSGLALPTLALLGGTAWAATVPAYTPETPAPLNIQHWESAGPVSNWVLSPDLEPVPAPLLGVAPFKKRSIPGNTGERTAAPAPSNAGTLPEVRIISDTIVSQQRQVILEINAPGADETHVVVPAEAGLTTVSFGKEIHSFDAKGGKGFRCIGRACLNWRMTVTIKPGAQKWSARALRYQLDETGRPLQRARPPNALPNQSGDVRVATQEFDL